MHFDAATHIAVWQNENLENLRVGTSIYNMCDNNLFLKFLHFRWKQGKRGTGQAWFVPVSRGKR